MCSQYDTSEEDFLKNDEIVHRLNSPLLLREELRIRRQLHTAYCNIIAFVRIMGNHCAGR
jgi:hypothetical protein